MSKQEKLQGKDTNYTCTLFLYISQVKVSAAQTGCELNKVVVPMITGETAELEPRCAQDIANTEQKIRSI